MSRFVTGAAYKMESVGTCGRGLGFIETIAECNAAAVDLGLADVVAGTAGLPDSDRPHGCYYKNSNPDNDKLWFNSAGNKNDDETNRVSICSTGGTTGAHTEKAGTRAILE